jgi:hypothetical protein
MNYTETSPHLRVTFLVFGRVNFSICQQELTNDSIRAKCRISTMANAVWTANCVTAEACLTKTAAC